MQTIAVAIRAVTYMAGFVLAFTWLALSAPELDAPSDTRLPPSVIPVGAALMVLGGLLALTCAACFIVRGRGTPAPFDPPRALVIVGPYRYVRNPMYIGGLLAWLGLGLLWRSWFVLVLTAALAVVVHLFVVLYEEPTLRRLFAADYDAYCRTVHRWLPIWFQRS
jgi:protein-S-isoprenylcysteine O-methyltransferase Ste14